MLKGHVDISSLGDWYQNLTYQLHPDPLTGFDFVDIKDKDRYSQSQLNVFLTRELDASVTEFFDNNFSWVGSRSYSVQKLVPGQLLPWHTDGYRRYSSANCVEPDQIIRIIVFLEDWQMGHISQVGDVVNTGYQAGDWMSWIGRTPHMAANIGHTDRYTLQITGVLNFKIS